MPQYFSQVGYILSQLTVVPVASGQRLKLRPDSHATMSDESRLHVKETVLARIGRAPWKGAFSWRVQIPPSNSSLQLVAASAGHGGNDMS